MRFSLSARLLLFFAAMAPAGLLILGCQSAPPASSGSETAASAVPATASPAVTQAQASEAADARLFTTTGPLVAEQQADIAAERDGRIANIGVQIGDHVKKGQLLAALDDRASVATCESQKAKVASLKAMVLEWESEEKVEESDLRRADAMLAEKIRSQEDWEHVKYKLDETKAEVARYRADEQAAEADLRFATIQLEQSRIVAPFAGVVGRSSLRLAQEVKKGDPLFWITAESPLHVLFTVPESAMAPFSTGSALELTSAVYPQLHQQARILRVSPVIDPASGSVQVIGLVVHPSALLKPGMTMQVRLAP